ncbi:MAG: hypothetical protein ACLRI7_14525 [Ruthenibacterium lactatiformans]
MLARPQYDGDLYRVESFDEGYTEPKVTLGASGRDNLRRRGSGSVLTNGRAAAVAEGSKPVLLHAGAGGLKEGLPMSTAAILGRL